MIHGVCMFASSLCRGISYAMHGLEVTGEKEICLLDFGMVCRVPCEHRRLWAQCVVHLVRRDHRAVLEDLIKQHGRAFFRDGSRPSL